jgi:hypothetical protein
MLGSIGKGDGDAATLLKKKRKKGVLMSTLKVLVQGFFRDYQCLEWNCNRRRSRSSSRVISGLFKSKKMKEARTLTGEQDRMFASAASAKRRAD